MLKHSDAYSGRVQVRRGFREEDIWRDALGGSEPLLCFVTYGPLDAVEQMPAGAMRSCSPKYGGASKCVVNRPGSY